MLKQIIEEYAEANDVTVSSVKVKLSKALFTGKYQTQDMFRLYHGKTKNITKDQIQVICDTLKISPLKFFNIEEETKLDKIKKLVNNISEVIDE
jgi:DNA-binding Xre family transcriptional regulator